MNRLFKSKITKIKSLIFTGMYSWLELRIRMVFRIPRLCQKEFEL